MKNILILVLSCFVFSLSAQNTFEGVVKITDSREVGGFAGEYFVKGNQVAANMPIDDKKVSKSIIDLEKDEVITLTEQRKKKVAVKRRRQMYSAARTAGNQKSDFKQVKIDNSGQFSKKSQQTSAAKPTPGKPIEVKVTKETKKIADYDCVKVVGKNEYSEVTAWIAKDLSLTFMELRPSPLGFGLIKEMISEEKGVKGLILEMTNRNLKTGKTYTVKSEVEAKKVKNKEFKIPKGYELVDYTQISGAAQRMPSAGDFDAIRNRAFEAQKKLREKQSQGGTAPQQEAAPKSDN